MTRGAKMMMLANNRNRSNQSGSRDGRMNYEMEGNYDPRSAYDVDSRFRDRRGREHYDNGRFAPMRNEMQGNRWFPPYYDVEINRYEYEMEPPENNYRNDMRGRESGSRGGRETRSGMNMGGYSDMEMNRWDRMDGGYSDADMRRGGSEMRMIGFERENDMRMASDASMPRYHEMDRMPGAKAMHGGAMSHGSPQFDERMAREWTAMMENEDGTKGPHWTMEQAKKVLEQRGLRCDPYEFWAVLNAIYSDDVAVAKKHGVNKMDYYVDRSVAWLEDKDAQEEKTAKYFHHVVKH